MEVSHTRTEFFHVEEQFVQKEQFEHSAQWNSLIFSSTCSLPLSIAGLDSTLHCVS